MNRDPNDMGAFGPAHIEGQKIGPDFWKGPEGAPGPVEYVKTATVLAMPLTYPSIIQTPEGEMTANAGDYLVTDNPPTHAWPVKREVFERTYVAVTSKGASE